MLANRNPNICRSKPVIVTKEVKTSTKITTAVKLNRRTSSISDVNLSVHLEITPPFLYPKRQIPYNFADYAVTDIKYAGIIDIIISLFTDDERLPKSFFLFDAYRASEKNTIRTQ